MNLCENRWTMFILTAHSHHLIYWNQLTAGNNEILNYYLILMSCSFVLFCSVLRNYMNISFQHIAKHFALGPA